MKAVLKKSSATEPFSFAFLDNDGKTVVRSENYKARDSAMGGISSVKKNCRDDAHYELKQSSNDKYYFNLKSSNGQIVATSVMFDSDARRAEMIALLKNAAESAPVEELAG